MMKHDPPNATPPASLTEGKVLSRRISARDRATVSLAYSPRDAAAIRSLIESIRLKGDRKVPLAVIARRSMGIYLDHMTRSRATRPDLFASEIAALEQMVTPDPQPAFRGRRTPT